MYFEHLFHRRKRSGHESQKIKKIQIMINGNVVESGVKP